MKRLITAIIIISILFCQVIAYADSDITITTKSEASEDWLWQTLMKYTDNNEVLTAGILGYFWRESFCQSDIVAGAHILGREYALKLNKEFKETIDKGLIDGSSKEYFIHALKYQYGGYGLGQWSSLLYDGALFDFAQEWGTSVADAEMQCAFTVKSIKEHPTKLWEYIQNEDNVLQVGRYIGIYYDGSDFGAEIIASKAVEYYKKYGTQ